MSRKKPQRLKDRLKEVTSAAILEAAEEVLLKQGLQAPMEVIAARAGVAVGTLYNHFADRKALVEALLATHRSRLYADVRAAEAATREAPVRTQLQAMLTAMIIGWSRLFLVIKQVEQYPDTKRRQQMRERMKDLFGPVIERGRAQGLIAPDPHGLHALALQGLLQSLFGLSADEPATLPPERAVEAVTDYFLGAVAKKGGKK